eukprot:CAMPEP_0118897080 /NCGR_PEP_ID=MMETSP1166-20130328/4636_1 /TAXON_ID=1104430 /ORGANISM="Chrysoreinhardia sp, Strain CCMP3193" /LENGTH=284 /DNA_ID=CAMNT_0006836147 /DNA_START=29 /DNA_END=883 /DNA_ORIENTATION=+
MVKVLGMLLAASYPTRPALGFVLAAAGRSFASVRRGFKTSIAVEGEEGTESYKQFFVNPSGEKVSPWHDIPMQPLDAPAFVFNMVTEIPKYGTAKMEVDTKAAKNPIVQDTKKGKLRFYHGPIFWNYGCIPQTWENPNEEHPELKCFGDNDPIDVVEIGTAALEPGSVTQVKALGVLAMIDDGELDWKVIAIAKGDPLYLDLNDVDDLEKLCPGVVSGIREWFRWYKTPDDKPLNAFGFDEACLDKTKAKDVILETHDAWKALHSGDIENSGKLWTKEDDDTAE